ncbi:MAG: phosphonate ABC transporter ATP-binding protein [Deltaproteobacteria bacterium]|nr:phosphonate ABC transporter ATP-binding protein [Deltaproteobacteria bacterium]
MSQSSNSATLGDNRILSVKNLVKTYPNGVQALKGVSFDVKRGEFLVVIGLSGSGKSTLLRCMNRLHHPTSGEIIYRGKDGVASDIAKAEGDEILRIRKTVGMIFQHFNLIPRHSVLNNVLYGSLGHTGTLRSILGLYSVEDEARALQYLKLVGIEDKAQYRAAQLSGGQQQRVAIARALTQAPDLLLADEPVASLDPATCHTVMDYLRRVNQELGLTIVCNLHFLSLVRQYATRVIALKGGKLVYEGSPSDINDQWFSQIYGEGAKEVHIN